MKKTGLGKGLDALFSDNLFVNEQNNTEDLSEKIHKIKVIEIEPNRDQPRRSFDEEALDELANSIKTYDVLQPIIVNKKEENNFEKIKTNFKIYYYYFFINHLYIYSIYSIHTRQYDCI